MMINQGINEVIADGFARDRGQRRSPSAKFRHTLRHYQDTAAGLPLVYQQVGAD